MPELMKCSVANCEERAVVAIRFKHTKPDREWGYCPRHDARPEGEHPNSNKRRNGWSPQQIESVRPL